MSIELLFTSKRLVRFQIEGPVASDSAIVSANQLPAIADLRDLMEFIRKQRIHVVEKEGGDQG